MCTTPPLSCRTPSSSAASRGTKTKPSRPDGELDNGPIRRARQLCVERDVDVSVAHPVVVDIGPSVVLAHAAHAPTTPGPAVGSSISSGHESGTACDALDGPGSPRLVLVREPDQLGVERAHPQLSFGVRLVELAEPNRHVPTDDDGTPAGLDEDALVPVRVPGRWQ